MGRLVRPLLLLLLLALAVTVAACASAATRDWDRCDDGHFPACVQAFGGDPATLDRDMYDCRREATWSRQEGFFTGPALAGPTLDRRLFLECMRARRGRPTGASTTRSGTGSAGRLTVVWNL